MIVKVITMIVVWLTGFIVAIKSRQFFLAILVAITILILIIDNSNIDRLNVDNKNLKEEQAKSIQEIKILKDKDAENKRKLSASELEASKQQEHQKIIQEFSVVASWNYRGKIEAGGGVKFDGPLSALLDKFVATENGKTTWQCNPTALDNYKEIIKKYPTSFVNIFS